MSRCGFSILNPISKILTLDIHIGIRFQISFFAVVVVVVVVVCLIKPLICSCEFSNGGNQMVSYGGRNSSEGRFLQTAVCAYCAAMLAVGSARAFINKV